MYSRTTIIQGWGGKSTNAQVALCTVPCLNFKHFHCRMTVKRYCLKCLILQSFQSNFVQFRHHHPQISLTSPKQPSQPLPPNCSSSSKEFSSALSGTTSTAQTEITSDRDVSEAKQGQRPLVKRLRHLTYTQQSRSAAEC